MIALVNGDNEHGYQTLQQRVLELFIHDLGQPWGRRPIEECGVVAGEKDGQIALRPKDAAELVTNRTTSLRYPNGMLQLRKQ